MVGSNIGIGMGSVLGMIIVYILTVVAMIDASNRDVIKVEFGFQSVIYRYCLCFRFYFTQMKSFSSPDGFGPSL